MYVSYYHYWKLGHLCECMSDTIDMFMEICKHIGKLLVMHPMSLITFKFLKYNVEFLLSQAHLWILCWIAFRNSILQYIYVSTTKLSHCNVYNYYYVFILRNVGWYVPVTENSLYTYIRLCLLKNATIHHRANNKLQIDAAPDNCDPTPKAFFQYENSHHKYMIVVGPSYHYIGNPWYNTNRNPWKDIMLVLKLPQGFLHLEKRCMFELNRMKFVPKNAF